MNPWTGRFNRARTRGPEPVSNAHGPQETQITKESEQSRKHRLRCSIQYCGPASCTTDQRPHGRHPRETCGSAFLITTDEIHGSAPPTSIWSRISRLNASSDGVDRPAVGGVPEPETELAGSPDCRTVAGNYDVLALPFHLCFVAIHLDAIDLEIHLVALRLIKDALKA